MKTLGDGSEMTKEDAEIILDNCSVYFDESSGETCCIDGWVNQKEFVAMGVLRGWIDGKTLQVVIK